MPDILSRQVIYMSDDASDTERTEYFSDAIIAIAATLLVVELKPPRFENLEGATLWDALAHDWPNFVAFAVSFVFIGIAWAAHHDMFKYIRRTNHVLLILNLIFLMAIALQPFSTALIADHYGKPTEMTAALVYYGILLSASLSYNAVWWYAVQGGLVSEDLNPQLLRALSLEHVAAPVLHAVALVVAIWSVPLSLIPLGLVYLLFALPRVTERWAAKSRHR